MEELLKAKLGYSTCQAYGGGGGGCISQGRGYTTDQGQIFVKVNTKSEAKRMFDGEYAGLEAITATGTVRCPKPIEVMQTPDMGTLLVMEYLDMTSLRGEAGRLGEQLANMHLHNSRLQERAASEASSVHRDKERHVVDQFGFDVTTCCGYLPQDNTWEADWPVFYARRLGQQIAMAEKNYGDREVTRLWSHLQRKVAGFFSEVEVTPALLHGDLWSGNVAQTDDGPVIFDPASFYGHHEYEFGIATMFGGFSQAFWKAYRAIVPKQPGWEARNQLYELFHHLNHW